jgi:membrane protein
MSKIKLQAKARTFYEQTDRLSGGVLGILVGSVQSFLDDHAAGAAASMAYYALFSLFPLLLFLVGFVSSVLEDEPVQQLVLDSVEKVLPTSQDLVKGNIEQALLVRGTVKIAGTIGLLWSATAFFSILTHNLDQAWHTAKARNFLFKRLVALAMVASLAGLLILWVISTTVFSLLPWFEVPILGDIVIYQTYSWSILSRLIPWFVIFVTFLNLYRWVPNTKVRWWEAVWGAVVAATGWEITKEIFGWYLTSGLARYQLVYGSLGAVVALMLWIYLSNLIVLFGAHISATVALHTRLKKN